MGQTFYDLDSEAHVEEKHTRADVLAHFDCSALEARKAMDRTDAELAAMWTLKRGGQEVFSMPRTAVFRSFVFNHLIHHRGQLSVAPAAERHPGAAHLRSVGRRGAVTTE